MKVLCIQASPRGTASTSIRLTDAFVEACRAADPSLRHSPALANPGRSYGRSPDHACHRRDGPDHPLTQTR